MIKIKRVSENKVIRPACIKYLKEFYNCKVWIKTGSHLEKKGQSDLQGICRDNGKRVDVELKIPQYDHKLDQAQSVHLREMYKAGGIAMCVTHPCFLFVTWVCKHCGHDSYGDICMECRKPKRSKEYRYNLIKSWEDANWKIVTY